MIDLLANAPLNGRPRLCDRQKKARIGDAGLSINHQRRMEENLM
jgi:hypothetical protein